MAPAAAAAGDESARLLVGEPVKVAGRGLGAGITKGVHGVEEHVRPGQPSQYYAGTGILSGDQLPGWCCTFWQWPCSSCAFFLVIGLQFLAPCCHPCLGTEYCFLPSQIFYTHTLYVIWNTLKGTWFGYLCCGGWWISLDPAILFITTFLATPAKFMFDEDKDIAFLMTFEEYVETKKGTFPPFSGRYRAIDGGGNHEKYTFLGQGRRGYAMNEPFMVLSPTVMPDPVAMQAALQRRTTFKGTAFAQNALATWFANVAIHDFFRSATGSDNKSVGGVDKPWVNLHSSYLDLQVLYGWNLELADSIRSKVGGHLSRIAENRFDGSRVPQSAIIVELLRREHNHVCDQLATKYPEDFNTDEALYQQARLIMGGVYTNIIFRQYGDQMFGENAPNGKIFTELRQDFGCTCACGPFQEVGNHVTFNFNLIYRWHTGIPREWDPVNVPSTKTDDEIRRLLAAELTWQAGGFGPNNMPAGLFPDSRISVPAAAVRDGRINGAPRLNDFRRRFFAAYKSFEDMCGDPELAAELAKWYPTVEDVELAVGCQVERCMSGGWGLGSTVGQAVVADAFSSIRQDRFYTKDFNETSYTKWGYSHAKSTILADVINRHLGMDIPRDIMLSRVPGWQGPPSWSELSGCYPVFQFDERGYPLGQGGRRIEPKFKKT